MRPDAASTIMRPVGVGFTSRGPIGVEGLTMTAGRPLVAHQRRHRFLGEEFRALVGADHVGERARRRLVGGAAVVREAQVATLLV